jgi:glutamate dehydrogenase (NAD(P)+)
VQDRQENFWTAGQVAEQVERVMVCAAEEVMARRRRDGVSVRAAATMLAVERVAEAHEVRGLYP